MCLKKLSVRSIYMPFSREACLARTKPRARQASRQIDGPLKYGFRLLSAAKPSNGNNAENPVLTDIDVSPTGIPERPCRRSGCDNS
jgi:hypothetical protein